MELWYYTTIAKGEDQQQFARKEKGPVPQIVLLRLLEKGIIDPSTSDSITMAWKQGMESWQPIHTVPPFKEVVEIQNKQWYYIDNDGAQKGPIFTRNILRKLRECGEIDGMSLVFSCSGDMTEWKPISEVPQLKNEVTKMAQEEEAAEKAMQFVENEENTKQLIFDSSTGDFEELLKTTTQTNSNTSKVETTEVTEKKSFQADDGIRYCWDEKEQDWVEDDNEDELGVQGNESKVADQQMNGSKRAIEHGDSDEDQEEDEVDPVNESKAVISTESAAIPAVSEGEKANKKKRKKRKKKGPNNWVYVTGLPKDLTLEEVKAHFSKVGLIEISPYDQQPKVKIYREADTGECKGDCSLCYNAEESVKLAIEILDGGYIRPGFQIKVSRADFSSIATLHDESHSSKGKSSSSRPALSQAQVKVARSAMKQALAWNEDDDIGVSKASALRIVVLEGMFTPADFEQDPDFGDELETDVAAECAKCGEIEKLTVFSQNIRGVVVVKFATSYAAQECIQMMNGRFFGGRKIRCFFWDGATNYTVTSRSLGMHSVTKRSTSITEMTSKTQEDNEEGVVPTVTGEEEDEEDEEVIERNRLDEFGDWLEKEQDDLPEEFRLRTE